MRTLDARSLVLLFTQVVAATAATACGQSAPEPETTAGEDAATPGDASPSDASPSDAERPDAAGFPDGQGSCGIDAAPWTVVADGGLDAADPYACRSSCSGPLGTTCEVLDGAAPATVSCRVLCAGGRRPEGLRRGAPSAPCAVGAYFASLAQLEAASVPAFRRVARELAGFRAPRRLVRAAERAAREEIRHARGARALARRHGAIDATFARASEQHRSLEAFAIENAIEGCVRETYGALVATWQARQASDPLVRAHFTRIARDETAHAALSLRIDAWARARLDASARARVAAARDAARTELRASIEHDTPAPSLAQIAGLPARDQAIALASLLEERLA